MAELSSTTNLVSVGHNPDAYTAATQALQRLRCRIPEGTRILIKPNAGRATPPGSGITTSPQVVAAVIDFLRECGADNLAIGESPITGVAAMEAFEATGIAQIAQDRGVELIDMDNSQPVTVGIPGGMAIDHLKVCPAVLEADFVISVPVVKMHMHTGVTLGVKNMKGALWRKEKVRLHQLPPDRDGRKSLDVAIADLATVLRPDFTVIDGTVGMEGLGPSAGTARRADFVVAGADPIACDSTAARLIGLDPAGIVHLALAAARGVGRMDGFRVEPESYLEWCQQFAPPPENIAIEWPNVTVHDKGACSACLSTLLMFMQTYSSGLADYRLDDGNIHLAIGKENSNLPPGTICIGNCAARHKADNTFVPGCPPVSSYIFEMICKGGKPGKK